MEGIGRLAGGVAHDFNNLLTAILGYVEMCKLDLPADLPADHPARLDLDEMATAGERAAGLTRQLLTFASRQIVAPVRLDLSDLVADSLKMLQRLLGDDIEIETALEPGAGHGRGGPGPDPAAAGQPDRQRPRRHARGRPACSSRRPTRPSTKSRARAHPGATSGPYVLLAVADTGIGMTEEVRAHLFEPFFTTKGLGKGTGLGLATCHGIVRSMGGHIRVYSEPGRGTTFRIYLPRKAGAADPGPMPAPATPRPTGGETVLVVEDEPHVRRLAVLGLRAHGYVVLEAADGAAAIHIAGRVGQTIDVVVSDVIDARHERARAARAALGHRPAGAGRVDVRPRRSWRSCPNRLPCAPLFCRSRSRPSVWPASSARSWTRQRVEPAGRDLSDGPDRERMAALEPARLTGDRSP